MYFNVGVCILGVCIVGVCNVGVCIVGVCIVGVCNVGVCIVGKCIVGLCCFPYYTCICVLPYVHIVSNIHTWRENNVTTQRYLFTIRAIVNIFYLTIITT